MLKTKLIGLLFLILLISSCKYFQKEKEPIPEPTIEFKVKLLDEGNNPIKANYSFEIYSNYSNSFSKLKEGETEDIYTIIYSGKLNQVYKLVFWDSTHYKQEELIKYPQSNYLNTLKFNEKNKKGKINISFIGELEKDKSNELTLNISLFNGTLKRFSVCFDYSMRIIKAEPKDSYIQCPYWWLNYSLYPHNNSRYYLATNQYRCPDTNYIENCNLVEREKCFVDKMPVPETLRSRATACFNIGSDIIDYYELPIIVRTMPFLAEEYLKVFLIDIENNIYEFQKRWY